MEEIEWSRLMAPLLLDLYLSVISKLPSANSKPISTTSWHSFNPLENGLQKNLLKLLSAPSYPKILLVPTFDLQYFIPKSGVKQIFFSFFIFLQNILQFSNS